MPTETFFNLPADKRDRIVEVSFQEFCEKDYDSASITAIVNSAGIAKGSFYQYFADKKDLYFYLLRVVGEAKMKFMQEQTSTTPQNFFERLEQMMVLGAEFAIANPVYNKFGSKVFSNSLKDETIAHMKRMAAEAYKGLILQGQAEGDVRDDVSLDLLVLFANSITVEFGNFIAQKSGLEFEELKDPEAIRKLDIASIASDLIRILRTGMDKEGVK